ncbi:MAG: hypothetical protein IIY58_00630, partial [Aeriscardovia sp.]|nr:hypothetical protein [Aeriscardovia sp.]
FSEIFSEKSEIQYGVPSDLFPDKEGMSNREWLSITRENFKRAGLDFDNPEDRRRASEAQSKKEWREEAEEDVKEEGWEGFKAGLSPRSRAKLEAGEPIEEGDVAADVLRIGEAAPLGVGIPAIVGRNVLESYLDEKNIGEAAKDLGIDIAAYMGTAGLGKYLGPYISRLARNTGLIGKAATTLEGLTKAGKGSREQVVKATQKALSGERADVLNPYATEAENIVKEAGLSESQAKRAKSVLSKYLEERDLGKVEKLAETETTKRPLRSGKVLEKEISQRAEELGKEAVESTMSKKFSFDDIAERIPQENADELLVMLQSKGLRTAKPVEVNGVSKFEKAYVGVEDLPTDAKEVGRDILESKVIEDYLKKNKDVLKKIYTSEAAQEVSQLYGTSPDPKLRGLYKFVLKTPVAYEKPLSLEGAATGGKAAARSAQRKLLTDYLGREYDFEEEEK